MSGHFDVAVVGGGVAGASCAIRLARSGLRVVVLEKESRARPKVCGEFLSGEGLPLLEELGVNLDSLGAARIERFRLHGPRLSAQAPLPLSGRGLSRASLDDVLLAIAESHGACLHRGARVRAVNHEGSGLRLEWESGAVSARQIVWATGKMDGGPFAMRVGRDDEFVGFKLHVHLRDAALEVVTGHVELFVFSGGYAGLCPVEEKRLNLCFVLAREWARLAPQDPHELLEWLALRHSVLAERLWGAHPLYARAVTIGRVPYGFVRASPLATGVSAIGDQAAVIPSLTGDGMTIALESARRAADALIHARPEGFHGLQEEMARWLRPQIRFGFHIHRAFRYPVLMDLAALGMRARPKSLAWVFDRTRVQMGS